MLNQLLWKDLVAFDDKQSKVCVHCAEFSMSCESEVAIVSVVCIEVAELCTQTDVFFQSVKVDSSTSGYLWFLMFFWGLAIGIQM